MPQYEVQFLVRVEVDADNIGSATNDTNIEVNVTELPPADQPRTPHVAFTWEATKRWDANGEVIEQWGDDDDFGPDDEAPELPP